MDIGFIGLGNIGIIIANNIARKYSLNIWNRTSKKTQYISLKSKPYDNINDFIKNSQLIFTCVTDHVAMNEILGSIDTKLLRNKTIIDLSTIKPSKSVELHNKLKQLNCKYIDLPITGSITGALSKNLKAFAGCSKHELYPYIKYINTNISHIEYTNKIGNGSKLKIMNQGMLLTNLLCTFEVNNIYTKINNTDKKLYEVLLNSMIDCPAFQLFCKSSSGDFKENIAPIANVIKDLSYFSELAKESNVSSPVINSCLDIIKTYVSENVNILNSDIKNLNGIYK